jgi:uncharacterized membrane protein YfcA
LEIVGYIAALVIGILLGLLGGGGSILTIPVLVYLFHVAPVKATAYSLFIVGFSSLIGAFLAFRKNQLQLGTAIRFGTPSIVSVFLTRKYLLPAIPQKIFQIGNFQLGKDALIMIIFAILMVAASYRMIVNIKMTEENDKPKKNKDLLIILEGIVVGFLTGLVGAGGGFLIIPAMVVMLGLRMKTAIGTSLAIIAANSLIGFTADLNNETMDWSFLGVFSLISFIGIFLGNYLGTFIEANKLKKAFGWFVLLMGITIMINEIF